MIVVEELERAKARGAKIYAEVLGYGLSSDADARLRPGSDGREPGARDADGVRRRRNRTGGRRLRERARHVDASGDPAETRVLKLALGEEHAYRTPVSSTKGATGHCLGAAGAVEAIFTILASERGVLPADDQLRGRPIPSATSTTSRTHRASNRSRSASRTRSGSAGTTRASCSAAGTETAPELARS